MNCCLHMINNNNNNSKKLIDITKTQYYGKVNTDFVPRVANAKSSVSFPLRSGKAVPSWAPTFLREPIPTSPSFTTGNIPFVSESRFCSAFGLTKPSTFTLRNDFFMCPPFHSYKILDEYDKNNIVIKERIYFYGDETHDGVGYEQYHDITFRSNGKYEIRIENLQTNKIQTYIFTIY